MTEAEPIKRLTIPCLELGGAQLLGQLLHHVQTVLEVLLSCCYEWTDNTIVLDWLRGDPKHFKSYVCNRVSNILGLFLPECWHHERGMVKLADCASQGLFPS